MPLRQYFAWVGSILVVAMFVADWCLPAPLSAPHPAIPPNERVNLRIRSDHKWPDKVVFDTMRTQFTPATPAPDVAASQSIDQAGRRSPLDAFAANDHQPARVRREMKPFLENRLIVEVQR